MFDSDFFTTVDLVKADCAVQPEGVSVVELRLADGTILDVCHVLFLGPGWLAAACYPFHGPHSRLMTEFVCYEFVTRISVSVQQVQTRRLGFDLQKSSSLRLIGPTATMEANE